MNQADLTVGGVISGGGGIEPWQIVSGTVTVTLTAATQGSTVVTFPRSFGTGIAPIVTFGIDSPATSTVSMVRLTGLTQNGFTCVVNAAAAVTATYIIGWIAVQMTETTAAG